MRKLLIVLAAITVLTVACGDDDDSSSDGTAADTASAESTAESTAESSEEPVGEPPVALEGDVNNKGTAEITGDEIEIEMDDFYFEPTFLKGTPGATVHLELANEGDEAHTFTSEALGVDQEVAPGESAEIDVTLPMEGAVQFHCNFHDGMGMQGAFFFNEGDTVASG
jgi:plastocyanin